MVSNSFKDITGQKFGKLTAIKRSGVTYSNGTVTWECLCDCGNIKNVNGNSLRNGSVTSCGCNKKVRICSICGSDKNVYSFKGKELYCIRHYWQMYNKGKIKRTYYDVNPNEIIKHDDYAEILIYNKENEVICSTNISLDKVELVKPYKWNLSLDSYVYASVNGKNISLHRFILQPKDNEFVDHIDRNRLNNRNENLRICTKQQNNMNTSINKNNTSGYTGVYYYKKLNKWSAYIYINYKGIFLGYYSNKEDAIRVRKEAEEKYFGEFAPK